MHTPAPPSRSHGASNGVGREVLAACGACTDES